MRYVGQALRAAGADPGAARRRGPSPTAPDAFHAVHERVYGYAHPGQPSEFVNVRVVHSASLPAAGATRRPRGEAGRRRRAAGSRRRTSRTPAASSRRPSTRRAHSPLGRRSSDPRSSSSRHDDSSCYPGQRAVLDEAENLVVAVGAASRIPRAQRWRHARLDHRSITLEVVRNRLETIADEMELTLLKSAALPDRQGGARRLGRDLRRARGDRSRRRRRRRSTSG